MNNIHYKHKWVLFTWLLPHHQERKLEALEVAAQIQAINRVNAVIKFDLNGIILDANQNFLDLMGYSLEEIKGKHHRMFVSEDYAESEAYKNFWKQLRRGEYASAEFKRLGKNGREVWIQATYNPIMDEKGNPFEVVKFATDVTEEKRRRLDEESQLAAVNRSQAVIEFDMAGTILTANENFLSLMGYTLQEVQGKHHRIFVDDKTANSSEYKAFWEKLNRGEFESAEFRRLGNHGKVVWIQGAYNPIFDEDGNPYKVVKFATDITDKKKVEQSFINREAEIKRNAADLQSRIKAYRDIVSQIQEGDLTKTLEVKGDDDLAVLGHHLNDMTDGLNEISSSISNVSHDIACSMEQLSSTAASQANSATEQATSVTEISSIVEEIAQTSQQTLDKATLLRKAASTTVKEGERGEKTIQDVLKSMATLQKKMHQIASTILNLSDKTQEISKITDTVSEIAKQSKMLALNASIEAAKAGESGKGFAVVADEVKDLADRSQNATENVQAILEDIRKTSEHAVMITEDGTKSVDENVDLSQSAGKIIQQLRAVIEESAAAYQQIVSAVKEESIGIEQVVSSMAQIDKVTSEFSKATENTRSAIKSLSKASQFLGESISKYKLKKEKGKKES